MDFDLARNAWQFNEAVSLLQDARRRLPAGELADEIDEGLPDIMEALKAAAFAIEEANIYPEPG